jgi:hypothetical protein
MPTWPYVDDYTAVRYEFHLMPIVMPIKSVEFNLASNTLVVFFSESRHPGAPTGSAVPWCAVSLERLEAGGNRRLVSPTSQHYGSGDPVNAAPSGAKPSCRGAVAATVITRAASAANLVHGCLPSGSPGPSLKAKGFQAAERAGRLLARLHRFRVRIIDWASDRLPQPAAVDS